MAGGEKKRTETKGLLSSVYGGTCTCSGVERRETEDWFVLGYGWLAYRIVASVVPMIKTSVAKALWIKQHDVRGSSIPPHYG